MTSETLYGILEISPASEVFDAATLRKAYKRALLKWHPDKHTGTAEKAKGTEVGARGDRIGEISIDTITAAYETLRDPARRREYDRTLMLENRRVGKPGRGVPNTQAQDEDEDNAAIVYKRLDLEDMLPTSTQDDAAEEQWSYSCRCGEEKGYILTERRLEEEIERTEREGTAKEQGEVWVGCEGCSLWIVVEFGIME